MTPQNTPVSPAASHPDREQKSPDVTLIWIHLFEKIKQAVVSLFF